MDLQVLSGVGVGVAWGIVALAVLMVFRGDLITRREGRALERQLEASVQREAVKDKTIAEFTSAIDTSNAMIRAVLNVAEERSP